MLTQRGKSVDSSSCSCDPLDFFVYVHMWAQPSSVRVLTSVSLQAQLCILCTHNKYWLTKQKSVEAGSKTGKSVDSLSRVERVVISGMDSCGEPQAPAEVNRGMGDGVLDTIFAKN